MLRPNTAAVMVITLFAVANLACGIHMPAQSHTDPHQGGDYPPTVATPEATGKSYTVPPAEPASGTGGLQVAITATGPDQDCQEDHYLFNVPSALLKESFPRLTYDEVLKGDQRFTNWVTSQHGRPEVKWVQFTVGSDSDSAAILTGMTIQILARSGLSNASYVVVGDGCGSILEPRYFSVDLGRRPPKIMALPGREDNGDPIPGARFPFKVSAGDPEEFNLIVRGGPAQEISWQVVLSYVLRGERRTKIIDDGGRPFNTVPEDEGIVATDLF